VKLGINGPAVPGHAGERPRQRYGVFAHGFVHWRCELCGHGLLVAFSYKGRGVCPSCAGRRMCDVAARLVDRVVPSVPLRQWVLSLPFDLRGLAAFRADVLSAFVRIVVEAVIARLRGSNIPTTGCSLFITAPMVAFLSSQLSSAVGSSRGQVIHPPARSRALASSTNVRAFSTSGRTSSTPSANAES
jgi:hypothetical protein